MTASTLNLLRAVDEPEVQTNLIPDVIYHGLGTVVTCKLLSFSVSNSTTGSFVDLYVDRNSLQFVFKNSSFVRLESFLHD